MQINAIDNKNYKIYNIKHLPFKSKRISYSQFFDEAEKKYLEGNIKVSLWSNCETNDYKGESIDLEKAKIVLDKINSYLENSFKDKRKKIEPNEISKWCVEYAERFKKSALANDFTLSKDTRDAIIVDYLNTVCRMQGIKLGLTTDYLYRF